MERKPRRIPGPRCEAATPQIAAFQQQQVALPCRFVLSPRHVTAPFGLSGVLQVFDMAGVQKARFCFNRKDPEHTYFPTDALYRINGTPLDGKLDLCGWGIRAADMAEVAKVSAAEHAFICRRGLNFPHEIFSPRHGFLFKDRLSESPRGHDSRPNFKDEVVVVGASRGSHRACPFCLALYQASLPHRRKNGHHRARSVCYMGVRYRLGGDGRSSFVLLPFFGLGRRTMVPATTIHRPPRARGCSHRFTGWHGSCPKGVSQRGDSRGDEESVRRYHLGMLPRTSTITASMMLELLGAHG